MQRSEILINALQIARNRSGYPIFPSSTGHPAPDECARVPNELR